MLVGRQVPCAEWSEGKNGDGGCRPLRNPKEDTSRWPSWSKVSLIDVVCRYCSGGVSFLSHSLVAAPDRARYQVGGWSMPKARVMRVYSLDATDVVEVLPKSPDTLSVLKAHIFIHSYPV